MRPLYQQLHFFISCVPLCLHLSHPPPSFFIASSFASSSSSTLRSALVRLDDDGSGGGGGSGGGDGGGGGGGSPHEALLAWQFDRGELEGLFSSSSSSSAGGDQLDFEARLIWCQEEKEGKKRKMRQAAEGLFCRVSGLKLGASLAVARCVLLYLCHKNENVATLFRFAPPPSHSRRE